MKDSKSDDESKLTFDYFKIHENFSEFYLKLSSRIHDILFNSFNECFFSADLKHAYFIINLHENDRPLFAFTISGMRQLQPTRMPQGSKSADFTMTEVINRAFGTISSRNEFDPESFFLHSISSFQISNLCFYMNDFFEKQSAGFFPLYRYLKNHFFSRIE